MRGRGRHAKRRSWLRLAWFICDGCVCCYWSEACLMNLFFFALAECYTFKARFGSATNWEPHFLLKEKEATMSILYQYITQYVPFLDIWPLISSLCTRILLSGNSVFLSYAGRKWWYDGDTQDNMMGFDSIFAASKPFPRLGRGLFPYCPVGRAWFVVAVVLTLTIAFLQQFFWGLGVGSSTYIFLKM